MHQKLQTLFFQQTKNEVCNFTNNFRLYFFNIQKIKSEILPKISDFIFSTYKKIKSEILPKISDFIFSTYKKKSEILQIFRLYFFNIQKNKV